MNNKKAQEEMVGFVMIMILVAIIMLVFLAIWIRQGPDEPDVSIEVSQFLDAMLEHTTECARFGTSYLSVDEMMNLCRDGRSCPAGIADGEDACEVVGDTAQEIIENTYAFGTESFEKSYNFKVIRTTNTPVEELVALGEECAGTTRGANTPRSNNIEIIFDICL